MNFTLENIDETFEHLLRGLSEEEEAMLEAKLLEAGRALDPIRYAEIDGRVLILDGHNRRRLCEAHGLPYESMKVDTVSTREEAIQWISDNQKARRNLSPDEQARLRGAVYNARIAAREAARAAAGSAMS